MRKKTASVNRAIIPQKSRIYGVLSCLKSTFLMSMRLLCIRRLVPGPCGDNSMHFYRSHISHEGDIVRAALEEAIELGTLELS